ncbi:MAG: hypothetical protein JSW62_04105 [Thermoplasmatales archaeon]|nr:MAG: hypothetical protein JSW62_04105 [Thermoplasmatales archaeon]
MRKNITKTLCLMSVIFLLSSTNVVGAVDKNEASNGSEDLDPLVDLKVTVEIKKIRALDEIDFITKTDFIFPILDFLTNPDFYVKIFINEEEFTSPVWHSTKYVEDAQWSATLNVPDDREDVNIRIELWDWSLKGDRMCDISKNDQMDPNSYDAELIYNLKTGHWSGRDDYIYPMQIIFDSSGYGRLNGCDDNTIYEKDMDCELWFDIYQNDADGDGIPYWMEVNEYSTDPEEDNTGMDEDNDGVPIEWEFKWGVYHSPWGGYNIFYDPFTWEDHANADPDEDGLQNVEEYLTSQWGSDPFRKDIFLEIDQMEIGPDGEGSVVPYLSKHMLRDAFSRQNIVLHIDDGCMGGGEMIPFDLNTSGEELDEFYLDYFLHNNYSNWRKGIFHYGIITYRSDRHPGFVFESDAFQISTKRHDEFHSTSDTWQKFLFDLMRRKTFNGDYQKAIVYASGIMHELGHTLGIWSWNVPGCDSQLTVWTPNHFKWLKWINYRSCMNYGWTYALVDYSDGSHGKNDFDDWSNLDLRLFQI